MLNQTDIERLSQIIRGTNDTNDNTWMEEIFSRGQDHPGLYELLEKDWNKELLILPILNPELRHLLDRIHHTIRIRENQNKQRPGITIIQFAAMMILPFLVMGRLKAKNMLGNTIVRSGDRALSVIHAPPGARVSFTLPDGTAGWLNSGPSLSYPTVFTKRKVTLDGEAWFDVTKNDKSHFMISACSSLVKVIGTNFNICACQNDQSAEVILRQWKVEFYPQSSSQRIDINPSEKMIFSNGSVNFSITDPSEYKAWTEGKLVFRSARMAEVVRRISRWYNVKIVIAHPDHEKFSFRGTFEDDTLEKLLQLLSKTSPIGNKITPRICRSDGTFDKEVITLFRKVL